MSMSLDVIKVLLLFGFETSSPAYSGEMMHSAHFPTQQPGFTTSGSSYVTSTLFLSILPHVGQCATMQNVWRACCIRTSRGTKEGIELSCVQVLLFHGCT